MSVCVWKDLSESECRGRAWKSLRWSLRRVGGGGRSRSEVTESESERISKKKKRLKKKKSDKRSETSGADCDSD